MNTALVDRLVNTLLYEGYMLYPYRPALKNRQRWTFGGIYPQSWSKANESSDAWSLRTECLVQGSDATTVSIKVRFLHLQDRLVGKLDHPLQELRDGEEPALHLVDKYHIGDRLLHTWQEAVEREHLVENLNIASLLSEPLESAFDFPANRRLEAVWGSHEEIVAVLIRQQETVTGLVRVCATRLAQDLFKVHVRIENHTPLEHADERSRDEALMRALVSTHAILEVHQGEFVSLIDPPEAMHDFAASCNNVGVWPVLVGDENNKGTMLASPIVLYDYPQIAPESAGNLFDSTEIDEILTLRIMTLTDEEKQTAIALDERTRAMLHRTSSLDSSDLLEMHGTFRGLRPGARGE